MSHVVRQDFTNGCTAGIGMDAIAPGISEVKLDTGATTLFIAREARSKRFP